MGRGGGRAPRAFLLGMEGGAPLLAPGLITVGFMGRGGGVTNSLITLRRPFLGPLRGEFYEKAGRSCTSMCVS